MKIFRRSKEIPSGVWALGFVSMFMDISSEMIHGLLPVFLVTVLGASAVTIGMIEGIGEGLALVTRVFSGVISDRLGKRKFLAGLGYFLGTISKPLFAAAASVQMALAARSFDRFGKGLRGAPRDALIADLTPQPLRGAAYGLRQSLDSVGAFVGPFLAVALMLATGNAFRRIFWIAGLFGLAAVAILVVFVKEPETQKSPAGQSPIQPSAFSQLSRPYFGVLGLGVIFTLARFSEAFLLLRAENVGLAAEYIPFILVILSLVYALGAYPAGRLSDRVGRMAPLGAGLLVLVLAELVLAVADSALLVAVGAALWGLHLAFTQGLFAALVADTAAEDVRGTAFGLFGLATGISMLIASVLAGWLWDRYSPQATFLAGSIFSFLALIGFIMLRGRLEKNAS